MDHSALVDHYSHGQLLQTIQSGVETMGLTPETVTIDDLAAVDEFHIGGRRATEAFLEQLILSSNDHVLDVGCGLGGTARYVAQTCGCRVTGVDLISEYIETGTALNDWTGLSDKVELQQGNALELPFEGASFDAAIMLHTGMNIEDKTSLFKEVGRVLKADAMVGVYDIMKLNDEPLDYPVPWAAVSELSALGTPEDYKNAFDSAGLRITGERNRRDFAVEFFEMLRKRNEAADGPPPLGLHILFGDDAALKVKNMVGNIATGRVAPIDMIARKAA